MAMMCMKSSTSVSSKFDRNVDVPLQKKMTSFTASARLLSLSSSPFGELFRDNFRYFQSKHRKESSEQQQQRGKKIIADDQRPLEWSFAGFLPLSLWLVFFFRWKLFIVFPGMKVSKEIIETFYSRIYIFCYRNIIIHHHAREFSLLRSQHKFVFMVDSGVGQ